MYKSNFLIKTGLCVLAVGMVACDDVINVDTGTADPILNVDAWINDKPEAQAIQLTTTQDYFDSDTPPAVSDASVQVTDSEGNVYVFAEDTVEEDGNYYWYPDETDTTLVHLDRSYTLTVMVDGETFIATSSAGRVPPIDSITFNYEEGEGMRDDQYTAEFWATDPEGTGDTYWIKTYKNGTFLNKSSELNIAYDAGTSSGTFDGVTFISMVRTRINAREDSDEGDMESPLSKGDSIYVEINSITEESFYYWNEVIEQTDRNGGMSEIFSSTPLANVSCNIMNEDENGSDVVGFFNTAVTSGMGITFESYSQASE